jgi:hypothetical protein
VYFKTRSFNNICHWEIIWLALDSGEAITQFYYSYDGKSLPYFIKMNFGGKNITKYLIKIIAD